MFKKLLFTFLLFIAPLAAYANEAPWGRGPGFITVGFSDNGAVTSTIINTNFVKDTSGQFIGAHFSSPINQTSGTLTWYVYCTAQAGTTDQTAAKIYPGPTGTEDAQRPAAGASELATSGTVDASGCGTAQWLTYSFTGVTLVEGNHYWIGVYNTEADPVTNTFSVLTRGIDDTYNNPATVSVYGVMTTADGFATDPSNGSTVMSPTVMKFNDGSITGMPFVASGGTHATNQNLRGMRVKFSEDVKVGCVDMSASDTGFAFVDLKIYNDSTEVDSIAFDRFTEGNTGEMCFPEVSLSGGIAYDFVITFSANDNTGTTHTMGNSPPADVQLINPNWTYVDGAAAGSLTETTTSIYFGTLLLSDNPAIASSSTDLLGVLQ